MEMKSICTIKIECMHVHGTGDAQADLNSIDLVLNNPRDTTYCTWYDMQLHYDET